MANRMRYLLSPDKKRSAALLMDHSPQLLQLQVEHNVVYLTRRLDGKGHGPPSGHTELYSLDKVSTVTEVFGHLRLCGETVAMFRHTTVDSDLCILYWLTINCLDLQFPAYDFIYRNHFRVTEIGDLETAIFRFHGFGIIIIRSRFHGRYISPDLMAPALTLTGFTVLARATCAAGTTLFTRLALTFAFSGFAMFALTVLTALAAFGPLIALALALTGFTVLARATCAAGTTLFTRLALTFAFSGFAMFALTVLTALAAFGPLIALALALTGFTVLARATCAAGTTLFTRLALTFAFSGFAMFALTVLTALAFNGISKGEVRKRSSAKKY